MTPLARLLTIDRQRTGMLTQMGACSVAGALETVEEMLSDAQDYANHEGPFWKEEQWKRQSR